MAKTACIDEWPQDQQLIDSIFRITTNTNIKSISKARNLSWIPGLGQLYAGKTREAITSFILTGSTGTITVLAFNAQLYYLSGLGLFPITLRFIIGGRAFASKQIELKNEEINSAIEKQITTNILSLINQKENIP
ncbi:MAG: hypothetical protein JXR39_01000 [Marinilabiliaceae bacterium]|nr:hypothetical protein [Marinilabiliaceae bacterium]